MPLNDCLANDKALGDLIGDWFGLDKNLGLAKTGMKRV